MRKALKRKHIEVGTHGEAIKGTTVRGWIDWECGGKRNREDVPF